MRDPSEGHFARRRLGGRVDDPRDFPDETEALRDRTPSERIEALQSDDPEVRRGQPRTSRASKTS
ncbi:MAG: hypothetical protein R3B09_06490 [Nannocystaceae bacterium]